MMVLARRLVWLVQGRGAILIAALLVMAALAAGLLWSGEWLLALLNLLLGALALRAAFAPAREGRTTASGVLRREESIDLLPAIPDPVVTVNRRGVVTGANEAARAVIPAVKRGEPLAFALRAPEVLEAVRAAISTGEPHDVEYGGRTPTEPLLAVRLRPLLDRDGRAAAVALFFADRTRERRVEAMRVDFIATVSHELRTPLASLVGFIDTIAGPARNDAAARDRFLGIMREQAGRMTRLVEDLLQLSRVELNEHVVPTAAVDLQALAAHMVEIMSPLARERGASIRMAFEDGLQSVRGDRDQLLRVVENLIENALKYGGKGGVVVGVRQTEDSKSVVLSVEDHGPGIAPEHIPRLTERFYRVSEAESRARGGTGLGLAIVKHIVGRHRGRLSIESELDRGTTVSVQLPVFGSDGGPALPVVVI